MATSLGASERWPAFSDSGSSLPCRDIALKRSSSSDDDERPPKRRNQASSRMPRTVVHTHPRIGTITASSEKDGVRQFLGLQYATLADRFASPVVREYTGTESISGIDIGSQVLHIPNGPEMEQRLLQHTLPASESPLSASDTEGLNMNITVPLDDECGIRSNKKLPVFAYIHGGGFNAGSAMWPQYDMANFVRLSRAKGRPCIALAFNYRLGAAGLLTSNELRKAGYRANNSILDQRAALLWIQEYILGFGGDPDNITIAGPVSCSYHLQSTVPLFKRVIILSVTSLQLQPGPAAAAERSYESLMASLGATAATTEEKLDMLRSMDPQEIRRKIQFNPLGPVNDPSIPLTSHTYADMYHGSAPIGARTWCESIIIGDCQFDGSIFGLRLAPRSKGIAAAFTASIRSSFAYSAGSGEKLLDLYGIKSDLADEVALEKILEIGTDLAFYAPTVAFAQGLHDSVKIFVYRFNEGNPWDGQWKGRANHALDVTFLLQNFRDYLEPAQQAMAEDMAENVFCFLYGQDPWDVWRCDHPRAKVFGPGGNSKIVSDVPAEIGRRDLVWQLAQVAEIDSYLQAFMTFLRGPPATASSANKDEAAMKPFISSSVTSSSVTSSSERSTSEPSVSTAATTPEAALSPQQVDRQQNVNDAIDNIREDICRSLGRHVLAIREELEEARRVRDETTSHLVENQERAAELECRLQKVLNAVKVAMMS